MERLSLPSSQLNRIVTLLASNFCFLSHTRHLQSPKLRFRSEVLTWLEDIVPPSQPIPMSEPTHNFGSFRKARASSTTSHSSPRFIPGSSDNHDTHLSEVHHGSLRSHDATLSSALNPFSASGPREPTRSSVHMLSYRGPIGKFDFFFWNDATCNC